MAYLARLTESLMAEKFLTAAAVSNGSAKAAQTLVAVAGIFGITGLAFFVYAAHLWLADHYQPDLAAAVTGGLSILLAAICSLIAYGFLQQRRLSMKALRNEIETLAAEILETADEYIGDPIKEHPKTAAAAASIAGYMLGNRMN